MYLYALQDRPEQHLHLMLHLSPQEQRQLLGDLIADPRWENLPLQERQLWLDQFKTNNRFCI